MNYDMNDSIPDLKIEQMDDGIGDGLIRFEHGLALHPLHMGHLAEKMGLVPPADPQEIIAAPPAAVLVFAADIAFGDPSESTPEGQRNARTFVDAVLSAAFAGGYTQGDVLRTLLARSRRTGRMLGMAQAACDAAGDAALRDVFKRAGLV
jgi:hypothetical protein